MKIFAKFISQIQRLKQKEFEQLTSSSNKNTGESGEFKEPQIFVNELLRLQANGLIDEKMVFDQILTMIAGVILF